MILPNLRMNQMYGDIQAPDFDSGMPDIESLFSRILNFRQQQQNQQYNDQFQQEQKQMRLQAIARAAAMEQASKPKDVVIDRNPIPAPRIGLPMDDDSIFGQDPRLAALAQKDRALEQNLDFKREQLGVNDDYRREVLEQRGRLGDVANEIRANRADVYRYKAMNPNLIFKESKGGNIFGLDPATGESFDTGVHTGTLSERDRLELLGEQDINEINTRGANAEALQSMRGNQTLAQIAARVAGQKDVNAAKPRPGELPTQSRVRQNLTLHQFINDRPELAQWITFGTDGTFTINKNTPPEIKNQINQAVYGSSGGPTSATPKVETKTEQKAPTAPKGWKYIRNSTNTGWTAVEDKGGK